MFQDEEVKQALPWERDRDHGIFQHCAECTPSSGLSRSEQSEPVVCSVLVLKLAHGVVCCVHAPNLASRAVCSVHAIHIRQCVVF
jgi:hypothetical protein